MGKTFENLTWDDLCDLMCGKSDDEIERDKEKAEKEAMKREKSQSMPYVR